LAKKYGGIDDTVSWTFGITIRRRIVSIAQR